MAPLIYYISHPDVVVDPLVPVPEWPLSPRGLERMRAMLGLDWVKDVEAVYASEEQKARDGAEVLARHFGLPVKTRKALGENDRSSTGYLEQQEFIRHRDAFFGRPSESVSGWETAEDAQTRIVSAVRAIAEEEEAKTLAIVAHGGVGALLLTSLLGRAMSLEQEQPGSSGGNWYAFDAGTWTLKSHWAPIDG